MAINTVTDLKDYVFRFLKKDEKIIFENNLLYLWSGTSGKIYSSHLIVLIHFRM